MLSCQILVKEFGRLASLLGLRRTWAVCSLQQRIFQAHPSFSTELLQQAEALLKNLDVLEIFFAATNKQPKSVAARAKKLAFQILLQEFGMITSYAELWL